MPEIMWALLVHQRIHKGKIYYCARISMNKRSSSKRNLKCDAKISGCHVIHVYPSGTVY